MQPFCCIPCTYFCNRKSNLTKHHATERHVDKIQNTNTRVIVEGEFKCKSCVKSYKSYQGLWAHNKKCKQADVAMGVSATLETDLHTKIDKLERVIDQLTVLVKNQQPTTTINNDKSINNTNNTNYIDIFLNDKCHNACDIRKFIAGIDFS